MPRLFAATDELTGSEVTLRGEAHHYLTRVLRLQAGASLCLFDGRGQEIEATVVRSGSQGVTLALGARTQSPMPHVPPVTLLQGLPRADRMDLIVQKAAELGAARLVPVRTERSAPGQRGRLDRWTRIAHEAERQCGRSQSLLVTDVMSLDEALAGLPEVDTEARIVPWEERPDAPSIHRLLVGQAATSAVALIGPEGGLTADEAERATRARFRVATLGPRILRTETAAIAALSVIQALLGGLGAP